VKPAAIKQQLRVDFDDARYEHILGVASTCRQLATRHRVDPDRAEIAGLLHDIGRRYTVDQLISMAEDADMAITEIALAKPGPILHGPIGALVAEQEFGVTDSDILTAIRLHTFGAEEMSALSKVVYLADKIEPGRQYSGVEELRRLAFDDLDRAMLMAYDQTLHYLIDHQELVFEQTIKARNKMLQKLRRAE